jgi:molybdenum cofactor biosynthesis enzyme
MYTALADFKFRHTKGAILESARTAATSAVKHLHSVAMSVHTRLFINRSSLSPADWMSVASNLLSWEISR